MSIRVDLVPFAALSVAACAAVKLLGARESTLTSAPICIRNSPLIVEFLKLRMRQIVASPVSCDEKANRKTGFPVSCLEFCSRGHTLLLSLQNGCVTYSSLPRMAGTIILGSGLLRLPQCELNRYHRRSLSTFSSCSNASIIIRTVLNSSCEDEDADLRDGKVFSAETPGQ